MNQLGLHKKKTVKTFKLRLIKQDVFWTLSAKSMNSSDPTVFSAHAFGICECFLSVL